MNAGKGRPITWAMAAFFASSLLLGHDSALADPPARVARLAHIDGVVSFSPAGEDEWALAQVNRPFVTGDRIWSDTGSRAELQVGEAWMRMGASTSTTILNLDDRIAQIQLAQGVLNLRVRQVYGNQLYEVDTPNLALTIRQAGEYRIEVDPAGNTTTIATLRGKADVYGEGVAYVIGERERYRFAGASLRDYELLELAPPDEFDRWAFDRDRRIDNAVSARYVAPQVIGYSDLDDYGTWSTVEGYGAVWAPTRVDSGWAPYRYGHWAWVDPWGWTWIDDAPWGFAPFHYGRWAFVRERWCWVPGPRRAQPVYAPALVAFVGGRSFSLSASSGPGVAWFPLAPGEVYRPAYAVSRNYFTNVNVSNTTINVNAVANAYSRPTSNVVYRNRERPGSITAVPTTAFAGGHPVARAAVPVSREMIARAPVTQAPAVAPTRASVTGVAPRAGAGQVAAKPPETVLSRPVIARTAPPAPAVPFAARESARPGRALEPTPGAASRPAAQASQPNIKLVTPTTPAVPPSRAEGAAARSQPPARVSTGAPPQGQEPQVGAAPPHQANVPRPPEAAKALPQEAFRPAPQANVPRPPEASRALPPQASVPRPPELQRGAPQEALRAPPRPPEAAKAPSPQANVARPVEPHVAPQEIPRAPSPQANARRPEPQRAAPPEAPRAPPPQASVARPPEAPRAPPPQAVAPRPQEAPRASPPQAVAPRPQEAPRAPPPQAVAPRPQEAPRAPPPQAVAPRPQEAPRAAPPQAMRAPPPQPTVQRAPEAPKGPPPQAAPPPPAQQAAAAKPAEAQRSKGQAEEKKKE